MTQILPAPFLSLPANPPPIVARYELGFLDHVRTGLDSSRFLSPEERQPVRDLMEEGAPARSVGDALFMAHGLSWSRRLKRKFGAAAVSYSLRDARCLLEDFPLSQRKEKLLDASFLEKLGPLDRSANAVLEVRWPIQMPMMSQVPLYFGLAHIDDVLAPLGLNVRCDVAHAMMRIPSLTLLERSALFFFGAQAVRFCMASGPVPKTDVNALHKEGYRAVGHPFLRKFADVARTPPFGYPLHDVAHGLLIARDVACWKRTAGVLLYEAIEETGLGDAAESLFKNEMADLLNLEVARGCLTQLVSEARRRLPRKDFRALIALYDSKLSEGLAADPAETGERARFVKRIRSLAG
ncbi:MAG TPA: hypothetical protein VFX30_02785 [bacterium]|nr:hypothetical protein [bacterium]